MIFEIPTGIIAKDFYKELIYSRLENADDNLFTNYNNYTRDEWCCSRTFDECWELIKELNKANKLLRFQRDRWAKEKQELEKKLEVAIKTLKALDDRLGGEFDILVSDALKKIEGE